MPYLMCVYHKNTDRWEVGHYLNDNRPMFYDDLATAQRSADRLNAMETQKRSIWVVVTVNLPPQPQKISDLFVIRNKISHRVLQDPEYGGDWLMDAATANGMMAVVSHLYEMVPAQQA